MKHLGDISTINGATVAPVDIITFGSPCQDLSVAGKQAGLDGSRSGLFREAVRIIKEMRDATNGKQPRFAIWENVPGAYSSNKGADFQTVLLELCKITEPKAPVIAIPKSGWPPAGQLTDVGGGSIAYRTIDAQFHGVPQRRRRIILVCDFTGQCAGNILFKPGGLPGYPAEGFCEGQSAARASDVGTDCAVIGFNGRQDPVSGSVAGTLDASAPQAQCITVFSPGAAARLGGHVWTDNTAPTLLAQANDNLPAVCYTIDPFASNSMKSDNPHSGFHETDVTRCLDTTSASPTCNQGGTVVVQGVDPYNSTVTGDKSSTLGVNCGMSTGRNGVMILQGSMIGRADENGPNGAGLAENACFTLTATDRHAVVVEHHPNDSRVNISENNTVQTLTGRMGTGGG